MVVKKTNIEGLLIIESDVFGDDRGFFLETYNRIRYEEFGIDQTFVQDNISKSLKGTIRGLHYQVGDKAQGKLCQVIQGRVQDVSVDIRFDSPTFGKYFSIELSDEDKKQLWIPPGFAHGFLSLTDHSEVIYKTTDYWAPEFERCISWDDPDLAIDWPLQGMKPILSKKDQEGAPFSTAELFP